MNESKTTHFDLEAIAEKVGFLRTDALAALMPHRWNAIRTTETAILTAVGYMVSASIHARGRAIPKAYASPSRNASAAGIVLRWVVIGKDGGKGCLRIEIPPILSSVEEWVYIKDGIPQRSLSNIAAHLAIFAVEGILREGTQEIADEDERAFAAAFEPRRLPLEQRV